VNDLNQWLQVDLGSKTRVARIATQGRADYNMWVILYMLQYSEDGQAFTFHRQNGDNSDTIFQGNTDKNTVVEHQLNPVIETRYVQIIPVAWFDRISMRIELYSC